MTVRSTALALVCAFGLHLAFPLTGWWWLSPFAIAGLTASWSRLEPRWAALVGFASGLVFFAFGFSWMGETAGALLGPAAPILDLGPALIEAPAFAFAAWVTSLAARRCDVRFVPVAAAAAFTLAELLRSTGVMGAPLEQIGVAMIDSPLRPIAAYLGVYGITFATVLLGATLGWWLLDRHDVRRRRTLLAAWLGVGACAALAWAVWPARHHAPPTRRVAAVQGGIAQTLKMSPDGLRVALERYTTLTASLAPRHPALVLWPETVITTELNGPRPDTHDIAMRIAKISRDLDATLFAGSLARIQPSGSANAMFVYDPHSSERASDASGASGVYAKEQLVPFAEYVPGPAWLRALPYADQIGIYMPGTNRVRTFAGATPLICWESLFGDIAHERLAENPSLLMIATDDAWFGTTEFPYEHAMAATLRAVETGRWVLRAGATGISGIVAPDGTWTQRTQLGGPAIVVGDVGAPAPGPYAALGPTPIGMALALGVLLPFLRAPSRVTLTWRTPAILAIFAFLAWVGFEIGRAGSDVVVQRVQQPSRLVHGKVNGRRLDGRAWSLDYDTVSLSADDTQATIGKVRQGRLHRKGKSDVLMQGDDVTVNRVTSDLFVRGPVSFKEDLGHGRTRTFATTGARYIGATRVLQIDHQATITDAGATIIVENMTIDFRTGDAKLGRIEGRRPGSLK